jgi:hypothetical protein
LIRGLLPSLTEAGNGEKKLKGSEKKSERAIQEWKRDDGTDGNNGRNGKLQPCFSAASVRFRYFCSFRHLSFCPNQTANSSRQEFSGSVFHNVMYNPPIFVPDKQLNSRVTKADL